jgi:hypothetical protein
VKGGRRDEQHCHGGLEVQIIRVGSAETASRTVLRVRAVQGTKVREIAVANATFMSVLSAADFNGI